jgi:hypothetical protein
LSAGDDSNAWPNSVSAARKAINLNERPSSPQAIAGRPRRSRAATAASVLPHSWQPAP